LWHTWVRHRKTAPSQFISLFFMRPVFHPLGRASKPHPRSKFSQSEDALLAKAVADVVVSDWQRIARRVPGRNARQCKERWLNYLSPAVGNDPWTPEEDQLLTRKYREIGPRWKHIAVFFKGRTDINVKSRWKVIQRRKRREANKRMRAMLSRRKQKTPSPEAEPKPPPLVDLWEPSTMNDKSPPEETFEVWPGASP
jgi:hypothetical protein